MGQYYVAIILGPAGEPREHIRCFVSSYTFGCGSKLMEHSYIGNRFTRTLEYLLSPKGPYWKSRVVWAGDYADEEPAEYEEAERKNLYTIAAEEEWKGYEPALTQEGTVEGYHYLVNHTKKLVVDMSKVSADQNGFRIHPLPLLTAEGNCRGGGDYDGAKMSLVGSWARDVMSVERELPAGFTLLDAEFGE